MPIDKKSPAPKGSLHTNTRLHLDNEIRELESVLTYLETNYKKNPNKTFLIKSIESTKKNITFLQSFLPNRQKGNQNDSRN